MFDIVLENHQKSLIGHNLTGSTVKKNDSSNRSAPNDFGSDWFVFMSRNESHAKIQPQGIVVIKLNLFFQSDNLTAKKRTN